MFIARATKERMPSLCTVKVNKRSERVTRRDHTTAFTTAVRSAQIEPPVTKHVKFHSEYIDLSFVKRKIIIPKDAFSTFAPLIIWPSGARRAAPTRNFE